MIGRVFMLQLKHLALFENGYYYNALNTYYKPLSPTTPTMTVISISSAPIHLGNSQAEEGLTIFFPTDEIYSLLNSPLHKWTNSSSLLTNLPSFRT